ncbi:MAG: hypothetical protein V3W44_00670 [Dehalococcoidales bacterium]
MSTEIAQVEGLDPLVALLTWLMTFVASKYALPARLRPAIPLVAIVIATGLMAAAESMQGEALSGATLVRGLGAGAAAIAGHSGVREALKVLSSPPAEEKDE